MTPHERTHLRTRLASSPNAHGAAVGIFRIALALLTIVACGVIPARAQDTTGQSERPQQYRNAGVDEHPNAQVPTDLTFYNETGQPIQLGSYFHPNRPVILQLGYFDCPKLCDVISRGVVDTVKQINLVGGKDFVYLFVSINPGESPNLAAVKRENYIEQYGKPGEGDGFHFMVGEPKNITALADAVGFRYQEVDLPGQYAHPAVIFILTPDGKISRYLYGVSVPPETMRLSLVEASQGKIGDSFDKLALMFCCYDITSGKYTLMAFRLMQVASVFTVAILGGSVLWMFRHGSRRRPAL
jgi:protein SCO1/2